MALASSSAISYMGNVVAALALPWFVFETSGSAARAGIVAFSATGPYAIGALIGGSFADRFGRKTFAIAADLLSGVALAAIPTLHLLEALEFWHLVLFTFAGAVLDAPGMAARKALVPDSAERAGTSIERAMSLLNTAEHSGYLVGAPLTGGLIALFGAPGALWVDAASFALSAVITVFAAPTMGARRLQERSYWSDFVEPLRVLRRDRLLTWLFGVHSFGNMLTAPIVPVLLPVFAKRVFESPGRLGLMVAAYGVGGIAGSAISGVLGERVSRRNVYAASFLIYPVLVLGLSTLPAFTPAMVILVLLGLFAGLVVPVEETIVQEHAAGPLRTRLFGTFMAAAMSLGSLGVLVLGFVLEEIGLRATFVVLGVGYGFLAVAAIATTRRET